VLTAGVKFQVIRENLAYIREAIAAACVKSGRAVSEVSLVCVSKNRSPEQVREVLAAGISDIGENKVQEALEHYKALSAKGCELSAVRWHMIGHLQTNKVKAAVKLFDLIHSVDSLRLAAEIDKQALKINKVQDILIEVKTSPEESKSGIESIGLPGLVNAVRGLKNVRLLGLMTMAPAGDAPEKAGFYFRKLRELKERINAAEGNNGFQHLSMGMSDDFQAAIEEGSTIVRLGRLVFEGKIR